MVTLEVIGVVEDFDDSCSVEVALLALEEGNADELVVATVSESAEELIVVGSPYELRDVTGVLCTSLWDDELTVSEVNVVLLRGGMSVLVVACVCRLVSLSMLVIVVEIFAPVSPLELVFSVFGLCEEGKL